LSYGPARRVGAAPTTLSFGDSAAQAGALRMEIGSPGWIFTSNENSIQSRARLIIPPRGNQKFDGVLAVAVNSEGRPGFTAARLETVTGKRRSGPGNW